MEEKKDKKEKVDKKEKSLKKLKNFKLSENFQKFKKTWLADTLNTLILIAILVAVFFLVNLGVKKWDPTAIDCTTSKDYSLTEESKERVKNIDKDVNIYFAEYDEDNVDYELAKQYNKVNSKINVELVDASKEIELAQKYSLTADTPTVVVECGKISRVLDSYDLVDYDYTTYTSSDVAEQKITSAILNVTSDYIPKVYFLTGYTDFDLSSNLASFAQYLEDEVLTYENLNILNKQQVPDDCDTLIIMTPNKDFDDLTRDAIIKYISKGGNILWFNGMYAENKDFKNVNKVLAQFGVNKFEKGVLYETDKDRIFGYDTCFAPEIEDSDILKDIKQGATILFNATKINIDESKFESLKVTETNLLTSSDRSYFDKELSTEGSKKNDEKGGFVVGAKLVKVISEAVESENEEEAKAAINSTLIIYGNDYFISDYPIQIASEYQQTVFSLLNNKDVALNSLAYLTNNDQDITIRKSYADSETTFTPSDMAKTIIRVIIFAVPVIIVITGIIVWIIRKNRN